jgi:hypothetical protein
MREIECTPMTHCINVWGLRLRVVAFLWDILIYFLLTVLPLWGFLMEICRIVLRTFLMMWYPDETSCLLVFFGLSQYFGQGSSFLLLSLRVDCECNRPSFLGTVFSQASAFNGDLSQWHVAKVADMSQSKSIRLLENGLTRLELVLLWLALTVNAIGLFFCDSVCFCFRLQQKPQSVGRRERCNYVY